MSLSKLHVKCRAEWYPGNMVKRGQVPDDKVSWDVAFPGYKAPRYDDASVADQPSWADCLYNLPEIRFHFHNDKGVNRYSHEGLYKLNDASHLPMNPRGRTGLRGRGLLGRFGPNHAADPIVTRWRRDPETKKVAVDDLGRPILEFVLIKRKDDPNPVIADREWAFPGGMVEPGDTVSATLKKEFGEEAMNSLEQAGDKQAALKALMDELFANGDLVYKGYVDDPRNTDEAWMETVAMHFHDADGSKFGRFRLHAGDDAAHVAWVAYADVVRMYASHKEWLDSVYQICCAKLQTQ